MEDALKLLKTTLDAILSHWPFLLFLGLAGVSVQVEATLLKEAVRRGIPPRWFWTIMRVTQSLHAIAVGAVVGYCLPHPEAGVVGREAMAYYAAAGLLSLGAYAFARARAKAAGVDLQLPGLDTVPSPAEEPK